MMMIRPKPPACPTHIAGKTEAEVEAELKGVPDADRIRPHKVFEGNRVRAQLIYLLCMHLQL